MTEVVAWCALVLSVVNLAVIVYAAVRLLALVKSLSGFGAMFPSSFPGQLTFPEEPAKVPGERG